MNITWYGLSCFEIETKHLEETATLILDPYQNGSGLRFPRTLSASIVAMTRDHEDQNNIEAISGDPFIIRGPGEYEIKSIFLYGIENGPVTIYRIEAEGLSIAHLGPLNRDLTDQELEQLPSIDVLLIPVGGQGVLAPATAVSLIERIEPRIVVPMYFALPNVKQELGELKDFFKVYGNAKIETVPKLKLKRSDLPTDETVVRVLERP